MGYQALLFCPDEKLARVVSQVFTELDFTIDPVHEPFAAVKKLMAQRYDAVVVDCENEQNASLLFKSARNSSFNQISLAIALVEGQAGVAKAYRIGANLVLTKPINVEQAKGTLRVARGLLRKNSDAAGASSAPTTPTSAATKTAPVSDPSSFQPPVRVVVPATPPPRHADVPQFEPSLPAAIPAIAASAKIEDAPVAIPAPVAQTQPVVAWEPLLEEPQLVAAPVQDAAKVAAPSAHSIGSALSSNSGSAAAPAPAKEAAASPAPAKENKTIAFEPAKTSQPSAVQASAPEKSTVAAPTFHSGGISDAPSFAALDEDNSGGSGANKKILIAAAVILAVVALGYFGYGKLGKSATTAPAPQAAVVPQNVAPQNSAQTAPASAPVTSSATSAATGKTAGTVPFNQPSASAVASPAIRIAANPEPETNKSSTTPMVVKSNKAAKTQAQADESAPVLPNVMASANDSSLPGLIASASPNLLRPTLATVRISQGVSQGLVIKRVQPKYPQAALAIHAGGAVLIEATVNKEGNIANLKVVNGDPILAKAALDAVRQWRYKPYYLDGEPVEIQTQITVNFKAN
jgi:TonB family protein